MLSFLAQLSLYSWRIFYNLDVGEAEEGIITETMSEVASEWLVVGDLPRWARKGRSSWQLE
jgi:hypothetical protein